jgi:DNA-directed RNA polymerase I subunit RPA12
MTWPFCPGCRSTLKVDKTGDIACNVCPYESNLNNMMGSNNGSGLSQLPTSITYSADRPTPLWAKTDKEQAALKQTSEPTRATIDEPCIKCGHEPVGYYTVQLRSVDEGQTVFYECSNCKHTWSINN